MSKKSAAVACAVVLVGLGANLFLLARRRFVPAAAAEVSRRFVAASLSGDFAGAYALTDRKGPVGATPALFESKLRRQLALGAVPDGRGVRLAGVVGAQSYGNRLRRWVRGRKLDPDEILLDYDVGILPFKVKLESDGRGGWTVVYFESHAE